MGTPNLQFLDPATAPPAHGLVQVFYYGLSESDVSVSISWPDGAKTGQPNVAGTRAQLRAMTHAAIDRAFDTLG
jgi:hypothetical protein